jgi:HemY protein
MHSKSAGLLLSLGRLALHNQLWGKAHSYLEKCIELSNHPDAYLVMGKLYEQEGKKDEALVSYRSGLALKSGTPADDTGLSHPTALPDRTGSMH